MNIVVQYFDGCPNWQTTARHLSRLVDEGLEATVDYELIDSHEEAEMRGFRGSPTVLIDGIDPFSNVDGPGGLSCRVYHTEAGLAGSPTIDQLRTAILRHNE